MKARWQTGAVALLTALMACSGESPSGPTEVERDGDWPIGSPSTAGLDSSILERMVSDIRSTPDHEVHSLLLVRHGQLVFERYFPGHEHEFSGLDFHGDLVTWDAKKRHLIMSITKSVTSMIVGIALEQGLLPGIDTPVLDFFPEYASLRSPEKDAITLEHLITMSSGLQWDQVSTPYSDPTNDVIRFFAAPDPIAFLLSRPLVATPGKTWNYNGGGINTLGAVVARAAGMSFFTYGSQHLFKPLGIEDVSWDTFWGGYYDMVSGNLRLRSRDLAKLGYLYLNDGVWDGRQIVPRQWIDLTTREYISRGPRFSQGYGWVIGDFASQSAYFHLGWGGQGLFVFPDLDMVFVVTKGNWIKAPTDFNPLQLVSNYVIPAVQ